MKVVEVDKFLAINCTEVNRLQRKYGDSGAIHDAYIEGVRDCGNNLRQAAGELVTCGECAFAYQFHRGLFCRTIRRSGEPVTDMLVERDGYCSFGRLKI